MEVTGVYQVVLNSVLENMWLLMLVVLVCLLYYHGIWKFQVLQRMGIKVPKPLPFVGNLMDNAASFFLYKNTQKFGNIWGYYFGKDPTIVVADVEMLQQILVKDFHKFVNRKMPQALMGEHHGLLRTRDGEWKRIRSTLTPVFTSAKMKLMIPLIEESCSRLTDEFQKTGGRGIDVWNWYGRFTMEVILSAAFGVKAQTITNPDDQYTKEAKQVFDPDFFSLLLSLLAPYLMRIYHVFFPLKRVVSIGHLRQIASQIIEARKSGKLEDRKDLLQLMLSAQVTQENGKKVQKLSSNEIVSQSVTFLLAGYDTTSNALSFTSYLLATHPEVQRKVMEEIDQLFPDDVMPNYDTLQDVPYLDMVLNEALRMYPPAPRFNRECNESCTVGSVYIPAGFTVAVPVYAIHHDPEHWPDPDVFDPERFSPEAKAARSPYAFLPFGSGPRSCIGMRFAVLEAKLALVHILKKYEFQCAPETQHPVEVKVGITMSPKNGLFLKVVPRN